MLHRKAIGLIAPCGFQPRPPESTGLRDLQQAPFWEFAIRASVSPGHGTEKIDVRRPICFDETAHNLTQNRIADRWNPQYAGILDRHS